MAGFNGKIIHKCASFAGHGSLPVFFGHLHGQRHRRSARMSDTDKSMEWEIPIFSAGPQHIRSRCSSAEGFAFSKSCSSQEQHIVSSQVHLRVFRQAKTFEDLEQTTPTPSPKCCMAFGRLEFFHAMLRKITSRE